MQMTRPRLWLLLFISSLHGKPFLDSGLCKGRGPGSIVFENAPTLPKADAFFDYNLCLNGLQWKCYFARECDDNGDPNRLKEAKAADMEKLKNCHAMLAIQYHTTDRWRVVMQGNNLSGNTSLIFMVNCNAEFECKMNKIDEVSGMASSSVRNVDIPQYDQFGLREGKKLMCEFAITAHTGLKHVLQMLAEGDFINTGMIAPNKTGKQPLASYHFSQAMYNDIAGVKAGSGERKMLCNIDIQHYSAKRIEEYGTDEDIKRINVDYLQFTCPADYEMRFREIRAGSEYKATKGMGCRTVETSIFVKNELGTDVAHPASMAAHCAQKKCKQCKAPACSNTAKCPQLTNIVGSKFAECVKLNCTMYGPGHVPVYFVDKLRAAADNATCDGSGWVVGNNTRLQDVECAPAHCPDALSIINFKSNDTEKFYITENNVTCKAGADMRYKDETDTEVRLQSVFCNFGTWLEERDAGNETYLGSELECYGRPNAPATGSLFLYSGIALGAIAVIVGLILIVFCCLSRRKKKARDSAVKHKLANATTQSRDSKTASKGTTSKGSGGPSSDRSVTGARGMKKRGGDKDEGPAIPDESGSGPKQPDPRSKPASGSSITKTSELQKLLEAEQKRKAAAALLETSKMEDNQEEQPPTDTPIDTAVIPKGGRTPILDGTQPDQPPTPVVPKPRVLRRPKKAVIIDSNEPPRPIDSPVPLDRILTPKPALATETPPSAMAKTQAGGAEGEQQEPEQPLWNNKAPASPAVEPVAVAATPTLDSHTQDDLKTSREKERDAAAESAARKKKIADMPTGKKKESAKKVKSNKTTTPKPESKEKKKGRPSLLRPSDLVSDKSSSKKGGGGEKGSAKKKEKRLSDEPSKKIDATQHQHVHGSELGCGPLCQPIPKSQTDSEEN